MNLNIEKPHSHSYSNRSVPKRLKEYNYIDTFLLYPFLLFTDLLVHTNKILNKLTTVKQSSPRASAVHYASEDKCT